VNAIGRVHTYLEDIGAINTNCITNPPRPKRSAVAHVEYYSDEDEQGAGQVPDWVMEYDGYVSLTAVIWNERLKVLMY